MDYWIRSSHYQLAKNKKALAGLLHKHSYEKPDEGERYLILYRLFVRQTVIFSMTQLWFLSLS